jgi:16S rRNA pseudouridine516 synthase
MSKKITLYQALKKTGLFHSKKELSDAVNKGRITVDGVQTRSLQFQFSPEKRKLCIDGKEISFVEKRYFVINKPMNYSCQRNDKHPYIVDILDISQDVKNSLFPVGRLDILTTGLLIITNDGEFASTILVPEKKLVKTYNIALKHAMTDEQLHALEKGVVIDVNGMKYTTLPAKTKRIDQKHILLSITEGKFRQVRKMVEAVHNEVESLERVAIGNLKVQLQEKEWKEYSKDELKELIRF